MTGLKAYRVWQEEISTCIASVPDDTLVHAANLLCASDIILTAGNGGSHALASHAAQALMKPDHEAGWARQAVCLSDAIPTLTAHANDGGWENALMELASPFLHSATHRGPHRGMVWLFSSSGKSKNVVRVGMLAQQLGHRIITFTGFDGGPLRALATVAVHVDSSDYEVIEPVHDALLHRVQYHLRGMQKGYL